MKKAGGYIVILIATAALTFLAGLFLGRNINRYPITVSPVPTVQQETINRKTSTSEPAKSAEEATSGKININTASFSELQTLPGIGEVLAQRIIDYRETHGPFSKITDLMDVEGIGEKTFEDLRKLITT